MLRFRLMALFALTTIVALSLLFLKPAWDANSEPLSVAPAEFQNIVNELELRFDIRNSPIGCEKRTDGGVCWRVLFTQKTLDLHLENLFLKPIQLDKKNQEIFERNFPKDWPSIGQHNVQWFACRYNEDWDANFGRWHLLVVDENQGMIYCYYTFWDFTP